MFKVGDIVAVYGGWDNKPRKATVKRVMKRFIELSSGSKFGPQGNVYPYEAYSCSYIKPWSEEIELEWRKNKLIDFIKGVQLDKLSLEQLRRIFNIIKETNEEGA